MKICQISSPTLTLSIPLEGVYHVKQLLHLKVHLDVKGVKQLLHLKVRLDVRGAKQNPWRKNLCLLKKNVKSAKQLPHLKVLLDVRGAKQLPHLKVHLDVRGAKQQQQLCLPLKTISTSFTHLLLCLYMEYGKHQNLQVKMWLNITYTS
ncbi:wsv128 [White spot syndrome virus]|uniref:Wsv128 n=1 Tax=White spot syndrome virus TaxID=342409 RepID=K7WJH8_9VIRU|nr:wsv128 [White spot syndrome virus]